MKNTKQQLLLKPETTHKLSLLAKEVDRAREDLCNVMRSSNVIFKVDPLSKPQNKTWLSFFETLKEPVPFTIKDKRIDYEIMNDKLIRFCKLQSEYYQLLVNQ